MKSIFITFLICLVFNQDSKLSGKYFVEFKNENSNKDYYIEFNKNTFKIIQSDSIKDSGKIKYGKTLTSLDNSFNSDIIIDFRTDEIGKDTINFQVHSKKVGVVNYLDVSVNSGRFIKIK